MRLLWEDRAWDLFVLAKAGQKNFKEDQCFVERH